MHCCVSLWTKQMAIRLWSLKQFTDIKGTTTGDLKAVNFYAIHFKILVYLSGRFWFLRIFEGVKHFLAVWVKTTLKVQCHEKFCFWFFSWISFPLAPEYTIRTVSNIFENSRIRRSRLTTGVVDAGGKWKKSSIRKILIILLGHLWIVEVSHIYIFAFKFTLKGQCHEIFDFCFFSWISFPQAPE